MKPSQSHKVGLGLRAPHYTYLEQRPTTNVAWLEAPTEEFLNSRGRPLELLSFLRQDYPLALHGSSLNIGNPEGLRTDYLQKLRDLIDRFEPFIVSDHLCWTGTGRENFHDLLPLPFTEDSLATVVNNIDFVQTFLKRPIVLENVSTYISYRNNEMTEWDFITEVSHRSGCALLLDLNNIYVNAYNHSYDPRYFMNHLPLERIAQIHMSGPTRFQDLFVDAGSADIPAPVWNLFKALAPHVRHLPVAIERDEDIPSFQHLENEVIKAATILGSTYESERSTEAV